jgi:ceramide glucosyltransferase
MAGSSSTMPSLPVSSLAITAGLALCAAAAAYSTLAAVLVLRRRERIGRPAGAADGDCAPVSILKPLCGAEPRLADCLRSFCRLDYPALQLVFGVREANDPAIETVRQLQREFPACDIALVVDPRVHGENLKASNLINMLPRARHEIVVISDSDVEAGAGYLHSVVQALQAPGVGSVTCLYRGRAGASLWSRVAAMFINDWYFPAVLVSQALGDRSFASGVTIALRRQTLERLGGLQVLADHLADDWLLCEHVRRLGLKTVLAPVVVQTGVAEAGFAAHARRELRWMRTIRTITPLGYAFMGLSIVLPFAVLGALLAWPSPWGLGLAALTLANRVAIHLLQRRRSATGLGYDWALVPLRDGLLLAVWVAGFLGKEITWRGRRYRVGSGGALSPVSRSPAEEDSIAGAHVPAAPRMGSE